MESELSRLFEHARWANLEAIRSLRSAPPLAHATAIIGHIVAAERIYLARILGKDPWPQDFWPTLSLENCITLVSRTSASYRELLTGGKLNLGQKARYRNTTGEYFDTAIGDLLLHIALHGSYHRGQIAILVRRAGGEPRSTDYVHYVRFQT